MLKIPCVDQVHEHYHVLDFVEHQFLDQQRFFAVAVDPTFQNRKNIYLKKINGSSRTSILFCSRLSSSTVMDSVNDRLRYVAWSTWVIDLNIAIGSFKRLNRWLVKRSSAISNVLIAF
jgi:hypothetical protein